MVKQWLGQNLFFQVKKMFITKVISWLDNFQKDAFFTKIFLVFYRIHRKKPFLLAFRRNILQ